MHIMSYKGMKTIAVQSSLLLDIMFLINIKSGDFLCRSELSLLMKFFFCGWEGGLREKY